MASSGKVEIPKSAVEPTPDEVGDLWVDTGVVPAVLKVCTDLSPVTYAAVGGGGGGVTDHGLLTGLGDDDHLQYHTDARGDARYSLLGHNHDHGVLLGLGDDDHAQYHNDARGDARYSLLAHTHTSAGITDFTEAAQDAVAALLTPDNGDIDFTYNDATPDVAAAIKARAVTYAKIQAVSATSRILGRITAGAGDIEELTGTQATTLLDVFTSLLKGLVPASGGGTANFLRADGTWAAPGGSGGGTLVYAPTPADVNIASITDVTIASDVVTGLAAGDQLIIEAEFIILNNSAATRNIIVTLDIGTTFDIELTMPALAFSATLMHPATIRGVLNVRSTSLAYFMTSLEMQLAAGIAAGTDTSAAATHLHAKGWNTTATDLTGSETVNLFMRSAAATATQTCRLLGFRIHKISPTDSGD